MSAEFLTTNLSEVTPPVLKKRATKLSGLRTRTKYTSAQLDALERVFTETQYPDSDAMEQLADILDVSVEKVSVWFQNRRAKFKRHAKDNHVSWMRKQIFRQEANPVSTNQTSCHVLSPPQNTLPLSTTSTDAHQRCQDNHDKPKATFHHLPDYSSHSIPFLDFKTPTSAYHTPGRIQPPSTPTGSLPCVNTSPLSSENPQQLSYETSLKLSHLLNDLPISPLFPMSPLPGRQSVFCFPYSPNSLVFNPQTNYSYYSSPLPYSTSNQL